MTEVSLPETVIALQRLDLLPETREVVEEAARLLQDGREIEARALVEKAEALAAQASNGKTNGNGKGHNGNGYNGHGNGNGNGNSDNRWPGTLLAPIAEKLASGFTAVLTSVLEDIYQHTGDQVQIVACVLEERIHGIEQALQKSDSMEERLDQLTASQHALCQAHQGTAGVVDQLRHAHGETAGAVDQLRHAHGETAGAVDQLRQAHGETAGAVDQIRNAGLDWRLSAVEERVNGIDQLVRDLQPQVSTVLNRLDRHTDALRQLEQRHSQRVSALNHVLDHLSRLREEEPAPESSLPLQ